MPWGEPTRPSSSKKASRSLEHHLRFQATLKEMSPKLKTFLRTEVLLPVVSPEVAG